MIQNRSLQDRINDIVKVDYDYPNREINPYIQEVADYYLKQQNDNMTQTHTTDKEQPMTNAFSDDDIMMIEKMKIRAKDVIVACHLDTPRFADNVVIAGGMFSSIFHGVKPKDYDVFLLDDEQGRQFEILQTLQKLNKNLKDTTELYSRNNDKIKMVLIDYNTNVQFIFTEYEHREDLIKHFDYAHTMVSYHKDKLYLTRKTFDAIRTKTLIVNNDKHTASWRKQKFLAAGWTEPATAPPWAPPWAPYSTNIAADIAKMQKKMEENGQ